jgi:hypothetical protein
MTDTVRYGASPFNISNDSRYRKRPELIPLKSRYNPYITGFGVRSAVIMKITGLLDVTPCIFIYL